MKTGFVLALLVATQPLAAASSPFRKDHSLEKTLMTHVIVDCALEKAGQDYWLNVFREISKEDKSGDRSVEYCALSKSRLTFRMPAVEMAGIFAENLYRRSNSSLPKLDGVPVIVFITNARMRHPVYPMADCVAQRKPEAVDKLARTAPGSVQESDVLQSLSEVALECGFKRVGRVQFRSAAIEMLFRRSAPSLRNAVTGAD